MKTAELQADVAILKHREMLVAQRTRAINALRGHAAECRAVAAKGTAQIAALLSKLASDDTIPAVAQAMFEQMGSHIEALEHRIATLNEELTRRHKANRASQLLAEIPGVGRLARSPWK